MKQRNENGFLQHYQNSLIDSIQFKFDGMCTIYFKDGGSADHFVGCNVVYNEQFGIPISPDGKLLFVNSWEKGLTAFRTTTGEKIWHFKATRIGTVFSFSDFLIAHKCDEALLKIDLFSGTLRQALKSGTLSGIYLLDNRYFFADRLRGKYCVIDAMTMANTKTYSLKSVNPSNCLSHTIRKAYLQDGRLYIEGFEDYPNRNYAVSCPNTFCREIDPDFYGDFRTEDKGRFA